MALKISNKAGLRYALAWISLIFCFSVVWHMSSSAIKSFFDDDKENIALKSSDNSTNDNIDFSDEPVADSVSNTPSTDSSSNQVENSLNQSPAPSPSASPQSNPYIKLMEMQRKSLEQRKASLAEQQEEEEEEEFEEELDEEDEEEGFNKDRVLKRNAYFATLSNQLKELQGKNKSKSKSRNKSRKKSRIQNEDNIDEEEEFEEDLDGEEFEDDLEEDIEFEDDFDNEDIRSDQTTY